MEHIYSQNSNWEVRTKLIIFSWEKVLWDAGYANAAEFFTELFAVHEEKRKYEEACKVWQEECVKAEIEATKNRQYYEDVVRVSTNKSR